MKRVFALCLSFFLLLILCGCTEKTPPTEPSWTDAKPVIYLYPEEKTEVSVSLELDGALTCTYPAYEGGWKVTAYPDGTLTDQKGQSYNYLYWEGIAAHDFDFSQGFCVPGSETAAFLEEALE